MISAERIPNNVGLSADKRLQRASARLRNLQREIREFYWNFKVTVDLLELRNLATVAALIVDSALGLAEAEQKAAVAQVAIVFNDLLPLVPLWERYGNNPALDVRVTGYPADGDPIYKNAVYGDNFVVLMIQDGTLKAKA